MMKPFAAVGALLAQALAVAGFMPFETRALEAQGMELVHYEVTGRFAYSRVNESSGVAVSRTQPGVIWTHNDSGDEARIFATNLSGDHLGTFEVRGAKARDWEDIALGPCPENGKSCLYIADTGDNNARRRSVVVYVIPEPLVDGDGDQKRKTEKARAIEIQYPTGPVDVEAIAVSAEGDMYLVSKGQQGRIVAFRLVADSVEAGVVTPVADTLPIQPQPALGRWVTGAALAPGANLMAIRTYTEIFFFTRVSSGRLQFTGDFCRLGTRQPRGEAIDFLDDSTLVLTTEGARGRRGLLARVRCRTRR